MTMDYIHEIRDFLDSSSINIDDYDDDRTYFDGFDDVFVVNLKDERYKFLQNYENGRYTYFTLYTPDKGEIHGFNSILKYFIVKFNI